MATYTKYKLTGHMLTRLSQIVNKHPNNWGMAFAALERRKLVTYDWPRTGEPPVATTAGIEALTPARKEGW